MDGITILSYVNMLLCVVVIIALIVAIYYGVMLFIEMKKAFAHFNTMQPKIEQTIADIQVIQEKVNEMNEASHAQTKLKTQRYGQIAGNVISRRKKRQMKQLQKQEKIIEKRLKQLKKQEKINHKAQKVRRKVSKSDGK